MNKLMRISKRLNLAAIAVLFAAVGCTVPPLPYPDPGDGAAPADAGQPDTSIDSGAPDVGVDAAADAAPVCAVAGRWVGTKDLTTGLTWQTPRGVSVAYAPMACASTRHPTVAELL